MTLTGFIYLIRSTLSHKVYCGQTIQPDPEQRWNNHKYNSITGRGNRHLANAIKKYGVESFDFSILETITASTLDELKTAVADSEDFWINYLRFVGVPLYNRRPASESNKGLKWSDESRRRRSEATKGRPSTFLGKHHTEATKRELAQAHLGLHPSDETRKKMSASQKIAKLGEQNPFFGKQHTAETKALMSETRKGAGNGMSGRKHSEGTKRKISETKRRKVLQ